MISVEKRFLFIHVPKTGGNSVQERLRAYSEDQVVRLESTHDGVDRFEVRSDRYATVKHSTLSQYAELVEPDIFRTLFKFATIRNPWDRLISRYFSPSRGVRQFDREAFKALVLSVEPLRHHIAVDSLRERVSQRVGTLLRPLVAKPLDADVNFLMRFEALDDDFRTVCEHLGIPRLPLSKRNVSERLAYVDYYDDELVDFVRDRFQEEIEYGNYQFEPGAPPVGALGVDG